MIKLRTENFGGLIFNTNNGVRLALDREGFVVTKKFIEQGSDRLSIKQELFLREIVSQLELNQKENYLIHHWQVKKLDYPFSVLNSPVLVDFQITSKCNLACPHCYAQASKFGRHVPLKDIITVLDQCQKAGVLEVALGGGEPTIHPDFVKILKIANQKSLVPNLATNGKAMTKTLAKKLARYCGAVALSIEFINDEFKKRRGYDFNKFLASAKLIKEAGLRLVFQITVSQTNLFKIKKTVKLLSSYQPYGMVFLTYKPVGRAKRFDSPLFNITNKKILAELKKCFSILQDNRIKIGYDCCMGNLLTGLDWEAKGEIYGCSALRESVAVDTNLNVLPCSFVMDQKLGNLKNQDLISIWHSYQSNSFRDKFKQKISQHKICQNCPHKTNCLGGCPAFNLVKCQNF